MAPKTKQPNVQGATMGSAPAGSYSSSRGVFGLSPQEVSPRDCRKKRYGMYGFWKRSNQCGWGLCACSLAGANNPDSEVLNFFLLIGVAFLLWKDVLSWDKYTCTPYFDGHLWRKYGQKRIKNSPFPRLYFRCSYNEDKHCMASKLMQQVSDDYPPMYKVTYMYKHTCNAAPIPAPDVVAEAELPAGMLLRFGSYGSDHRNNAGRMHQEQREYNQPMSWSPFELLGFDSSNSQLQQQPVLSFGVTPSTAGSSSSSFPIVESTPMLPATNDDSSEGDVLSTWSSFSYGVDEGHLHSENHADFAGNTGPASRG